MSEEVMDIVNQSRRLKNALIGGPIRADSSVLAYLIWLIKANDLEGAKQAIENEASFSEQEKTQLKVYLNSASDILQNLAASYSNQALEDVILSNDYKLNLWDLKSPDEFGQIILALMHQENCKSALDYYSGIGDFLLDIRDELPQASLTGFEPDLDSRMVAKIRSLVSDADISYISDDPDEYLRDTDKFDFIMSLGGYRRPTPEMESKLRSLTTTLNLPESKARSDWMLSAYLYTHLNDGGEYFMLSGDGNLSHSQESIMRETFLRRGWIKSIIRLPRKSNYRRRHGDYYLVIFGENKNDTIRMIDLQGNEKKKTSKRGRYSNVKPEPYFFAFEDRENCRKIAVEEIISNNSILLPEKYLYPIPAPENAIPLKELVTQFQTGIHMSSSYLEELVSKQRTRFVMLKSSSIQDGQIDYQNVDYLREFPERLEKAIVSPGDLIVTRIANPFKTAVLAKQDDTVVVLGGNLIAFKLDESKINPWFLQAYFESEHGKEALDDLSNSSSRSISLSALEDLLVPCPSREKQDKIAEEFIKLSLNLRRAQMEVEQIRQKIKNVYENGSENMD